MRRRRNWDVALVEALGPLRGETLRWGETDCVSLCLTALRAMYDDPPLPDDLPTWTTKTGALRVLKREPPFHELLREHGSEPVKLTLAQSGDIAHGLPTEGEFPGYGVCVEHGLLHVDLTREMVVWDRLRSVRTAEIDLQLLRPPHE